MFYAWANTWKNPFFENWNICKDISSIAAPVFALQGENDQYGTIKQLELIKESISSNVTTLLLNQCSHHPHLEQPKEVILNIQDWMNTTVFLS